MANNDKENKIKKFTKEAIGKTLNQFNKEIGMADLVEINKNQDRILNGILSQVNDENTEKTEKSNIITLDNSTDGVVELKEIQGDTNVNVSKIEEMPITHDIGEKEGNVFNLNEITKGAISIGEIQGNTMVNCNKDDKKELVLMKDLSTQGDNNITLTEGVDGGLVDVALEGNTLVNVSKTKDSTAITKAYTVENSGNHIPLQGDVDGSCRPVITGNTLVNLIDKFGDCISSQEAYTATNKGFTLTKNHDGGISYFIYKLKYALDKSKKYTIIYDIVENTLVNTDANFGIYTDGVYGAMGSTTTTGGSADGKLGRIISVHPVKASDEDLDRLSLGVHQGDAGGKIVIDNLMLLEGDYTNKPIPDYFEGLQSTFEDNLVTREMVDNGEEEADNFGKYRVDYVISREDGTVGQTKTFYLNSPLLEGDTIEQQGDNVVHVHRSELRAYQTDDELTLPTDMTNTLVAKAAPQYEVISQNDTILCDSYVNGHLDVDSVVPIEKVDFLPFEEELTYLYPSTQYAVQFVSDAVNKVDITLGGATLLNQNVVVGTNKYMITTPSELIDNNLVLNGEGFNASNIVVTQATDQDFGYFEGMKSVGECEDLEVVSSNLDGTQSNTQTPTHEPLRAVGDVKDKYVLIDGKWYIERNCGTLVLDEKVEWAQFDDSVTPNNPRRYTAYFKDVDAKFSDTYASCIMVSDKWKVVNNDTDTPHIRLSYSSWLGYGIFWIYSPITRDKYELQQYLKQNPITIIYQRATPQYEPIDYNPFTVYSSTTHISNNSTIPCNMTIKNTGYNCLLKPSTTYTVSSNLGLNVITTPSTLTEDCLRFYDTDTSEFTTMKNVMVLEGDYTTNGKPLPSHFAGIESAFEQEYDEAVSKYKVKAKVVGKNLFDKDNTIFNQNKIINNITGDVYGGNDIVTDLILNNLIPNIEYTISSNIISYNKIAFYNINNEFIKVYEFASRVGSFVVPNNCAYYRVSVYPINELDISTIQIEQGTEATSYEPYKESVIEFYINEPLRGIGDVKDKVYIKNDKVVVERNCGIRPYEDGDFGTYPTDKIDTVYPLAEPTYEEVEYSSNRLILNTFNNESFNNSTLFLDTNILPKLSFKPLYEELTYVKSNTKYYIQFNAVGSGEVVISLGGTELTTEIVEGYNCIPIITPSESTNLMTISGQGITISEVVVSEVVCGGYYKGLQSCFEEHMENGKYRILLRGIALDGSKVNGIKLYINEPLRGIEDVKDKLCIKDGKLMVERKCSSVTFDGSDDENWRFHKLESSGKYAYVSGKSLGKYKINNDIISNIKSVNWSNEPWTITDNYFISFEGTGGNIYSYTDYINLNDFKSNLNNNPIILVYPKDTIIYEEATNEYGLPIVFEGYENGIVYIDSAVTPTTHIKYTSNNQLATTLAEAEEQNIATQEDINMNVVTYMMDIDMILTEMEMSNDTSVMAVRRDSSNENMLDRMSEEDKKVYRDNTVVMLEKMITANVLEKEDIEGRINMYYNKNRISKEQYEYLKSLL